MTMKQENKQKLHVLFVAEPATLAHVVRPSLLAQYAIDAGYRVSFATNGSIESWLMPELCERHALATILPSEFLTALRRGAWPYGYERLQRYCRADTHLIEQLEPDVIVGDMRLSLAISARRSNIPYIAISNAYWSPSSKGDTWPLPSTGPLKGLPLPLAQWIFSKVFPINLKRYLAVHNRLRKEYSMPKYESFLHAFCDGDATLYADPQELYPSFNTTLSDERFLGALSWSPDLPPIEAPEGNEPLVYLSLGSSGNDRSFSMLVQSLSNAGLRLIATTGYGKPGYSFNNKVAHAPFVNGHAACQAADIVICNGGSPTAYQALSAGKPVIGIPDNLDQYLCMRTLLEKGCAVQVRSELVKQTNISQLALDSLKNETLQTAAQAVMADLNQYSARDLFLSALEDVSGLSPSKTENHTVRSTASSFVGGLQ
jgi:UDP:flavonoid glycosyltransferase YjiC (YdhE family)